MKANRVLRLKRTALPLSVVLGSLLLTGNSSAQESLRNADSSPAINFTIEPDDPDRIRHGSEVSLDVSRATFNVAPVTLATTPAATLGPSAKVDDADVETKEHHVDDHGPHKMVLPEGLRYSPYDPSVFAPDPDYSAEAYDPEAQKQIYGGKRAVFTPRPLLELGRPQYKAGPLQRSGDIALNQYNRATTALHVYGDFRTSVAINHDGKNDRDLIATRLNLDIDLKLTGTERIHAFIRPLDKNNEFSRIEFQDGGNSELFVDGNLETLFFEGDLGAIISTLADKPSPLDLPFAIGLMPLLFQNGLWLEDAFTGAAFTIPGRNSRTMDISNFDITFFAGFDKVSSPGIRDKFGQIADEDVNLYGVATFWELLGGYAEVDYAFIDGQNRFDDLDHHNFSIAFSKRYKDVFSTSIRYMTTFGQDPIDRQKTADGTLLVWENSLISSRPSTLIPYANFFAAFDRPQSVARDNGGLLKTVGINFETDALTGYPLLDDTGQDVWGAAIGLQNLYSLDQQLVIELATVQLMDDDAPLGKAVGNQVALGVRYQKPLSRSWIFRADAIKGWLQDDEDFSGVRIELRRKF